MTHPCSKERSRRGDMSSRHSTAARWILGATICIAAAASAGHVAAAPITGRFLVGQETARDTRTGLVWQRAYGASANWNAAAAYCSQLTADGSQGFRLPTVGELAGLIDPDATSAPTLVEPSLFPTATNLDYWTSTASASTSGSHWSVSLNSGITSISADATSLYVRCVR